MSFKILNTDFVKPSDDCELCDEDSGYVCQDHERDQVKEKYPKATYLGYGEWLEGDENDQ